MARLTDLKVDRHLPRPAPKAVPPTRRGPAVLGRVAQYLRDVRAELTRVDWPTRPELVASTIVVVVVLVLMSAYMGGWDYLFNFIFLLLTKRVPGR